MSSASSNTARRTRPADTRSSSSSSCSARPAPPGRAKGEPMPELPPYQIRLVVGRDGDGFEARWIEQDGQPSSPFPLALQGVTIRRQLQGAGRPRQDANGVPLADRLRMLLIVSRPSDIGFIDPRNSIAPMLDVLDDLPGQVELEFCDPPTLQHLEQL